MERHYRDQNQMPPGKESGVVNYEPTIEEVSYQPNWFNLSKGGGGDPDLADY